MDTKESRFRRFTEFKGLRQIFSDAAKPIGSGFSSLIIDVGDSTVLKLYEPNTFSIEQNKQHLLNEAHILEAFNGRIGAFQTPKLTAPAVLFEEDAPIAKHFIGYIHMTKLEGHTPEWADISKVMKEQEEHIYFHQIGQLIATFHQEGAKLGTPLSTVLRPYQIAKDWITNPEIAATVDACNRWFAQQQIPGFIHDDVGGRNIVVDQNNQVAGLLDFSFAAYRSNYMRDFSNIHQDKLSPAIKGYEEVSGEAVNTSLAHMTRIQGLSSYIQTLQNAVGVEKEFIRLRADFDAWITSIARDLALQ